MHRVMPGPGPLSRRRQTALDNLNKHLKETTNHSEQQVERHKKEAETLKNKIS